MNKKVIIITVICVFGIIFAALGIGAYFFIEKENQKLTLTYLISQCKEEGSYDEIEYKNDEYVATYTGTKYICYSKDYNQLIKFKEDEKSSQETYAFRVETPEYVGNGGNRFEYEVGRIVIDTVNPKVSKCTYNYRGKADWKPCVEKDFIKTLPEISVLKAQSYEILKPLIKELNEREIKALQGEGSDYNNAKAEEAFEKYEKQLDVLRNTSLK